MKVYLDRVAFINHSNNYLYEPSTLERLDRIDPELALKYFNDCYKNPAAFTVCFTGNIEVCPSMKPFDIVARVKAIVQAISLAPSIKLLILNALAVYQNSNPAVPLFFFRRA